MSTESTKLSMVITNVLGKELTIEVGNHYQDLTGDSFKVIKIMESQGEVELLVSKAGIDDSILVNASFIASEVESPTQESEPAEPETTREVTVKPSVRKSNRDTEFLNRLTGNKAVKELSKDGNDKSMMLKIPQLALRAVADSMTTDKYPRHNHTKPIENVLLIEAALRHINDWATGVDIDESGNHHLAHAASNLLMALDQALTGKAIEGRDPTYLTLNNKKDDQKR